MTRREQGDESSFRIRDCTSSILKKNICFFILLLSVSEVSAYFRDNAV